MPVTVICVGKLRERFFADAAQEYVKRLRRLEGQNSHAAARLLGKEE